MATKVLVIGYGNPGRLDDGLGPAFAEHLAEKAMPGVTVDSNYQLTIEDAAAVAAHDVVIFADASVTGGEPFALLPVKPGLQIGFSSHSVEPATVLAMAIEMFGAGTKAFALAIRGYEFNEFGERLSDKARHNLTAAVDFAEEFIRADAFGAIQAPPATAVEPPPAVFELTVRDLS